MRALIFLVLCVSASAHAESNWHIANVEENHCYELSSVSEYGQPVTTPDEVIAILRAEDSRLVTNVERPGIDVVVTLANGEEILFLPLPELCKNHLAKIDMERRRQEKQGAEEKAAKAAEISLDARYPDEGTWYVGYGRQTVLDITDPEYGLPTTLQSRGRYVRRNVDCRKLSEFLRVTKSDVPFAESLEELELRLEEKYKRPAHISKNNETERVAYLIYFHTRKYPTPGLEFEETILFASTGDRIATGFYAYRNRELCEAVVKLRWDFSLREISFGTGNELKGRQKMIAQEMEKHPKYFMSEESRNDPRW